MKIGYDAKRAFFNFTGLGNYSRTLIKELQKLIPENKYILFTPRVKTNPFLNLNNIKIIEPTGFFNRTFPSFWRRNGIIKNIINEKPDIYHGLSHELPGDLSKYGIKTVLTIHDLIFLKYPGLFKPWDAFLYKRRYLKSCIWADKIIAISENTRKDLIEELKIPGDKIKVVYQSVSSDYYTEIPASLAQSVKEKYKLPEKYILYVGSLNKRKNVSRLVEAFSVIKDKGLNLVIVGKGEELASIREISRKLNLDKKILYLTSVESPELRVLYNKAMAFVYPSLYEGFGLPILESLLCETPVITGKGSCFSEAGGPGALYVDVTSREDIARAIDHLDSEEIRKELIEKSRSHVQKFTGKSFAQKTYEVYQEVLNEIS